MKQIKKKIQEANSIALKLIEFRARKILSINPSLHEFVMGMGRAFFTDHTGQPVYLEYRTKSVFNVINEFDDVLHLTGNPMRFTAKGKKCTNW